MRPTPFVAFSGSEVKQRTATTRDFLRSAGARDFQIPKRCVPRPTRRRCQEDGEFAANLHSRYRDSRARAFRCHSAWLIVKDSCRPWLMRVSREACLPRQKIWKMTRRRQKRRGRKNRGSRSNTQRSTATNDLTSFLVGWHVAVTHAEPPCIPLYLTQHLFHPAQSIR